MPPSAREAIPSDRRRFPRTAHPREASTLIRLPGTPAQLVDLGLGGALIELPARLAPGVITPVTLRTGAAEIRTRAHIRRAFVTRLVRTGTGESSVLYRAGLEFEPLSRDDARAVGAILSAGDCLRTVGEAPLQALSNAAAPSGGPPAAPAPMVYVRFPKRWATTRKRTAAIARAPHASGFILVRVLPSIERMDLCQYGRLNMHVAGFSATRVERAIINGFPACRGAYYGWFDGMGPVIADAVHVAVGDRTYLVAGAAAWSAYETMRSEIVAAVHSFATKPEPGATSLDLEKGDILNLRGGDLTLDACDPRGVASIGVPGEASGSADLSW